MATKKQKVTHRFGDLRFPQDQYGVTTGMKKEIIKAASKIRGRDDKRKVFDETLAILMEYVDVKFEFDKERFAAQADECARIAAEQAEEDTEETDTEAEKTADDLFLD